MEVKIVGANLCVRLSELLFDKISFVVNIYFLDGTQEQVKSADNCILEIGLDYLSITPQRESIPPGHEDSEHLIPDTPHIIPFTSIRSIDLLV